MFKVMIVMVLIMMSSVFAHTNRTEVTSVPLSYAGCNATVNSAATFDKTLFFGGVSSRVASADCYMVTNGVQVWKTIQNPAKTITARYGSAVCTATTYKATGANTYMYIIGGVAGGVPVNHIYKTTDGVNFVKHCTTPYIKDSDQVETEMPGIYNATVSWNKYNSKMYLFGGIFPLGVQNTHLYSSSTGEVWTIVK